MTDHPPTPESPAPDRAPMDALVARTEGVQPWRRVFHAASGVVLALGPVALGLDHRITAGILALGTVLLLGVDLLRLRAPAANRLFFIALSRLASPREAAGIASSTWFALGAAMVWWLVPGVPAVGGLLVLALADPAASVVGRLRGRRPLGKGTVEGTAVFLAVALVVLWVVVGPPYALVGAVVAAAAEVAPSGLDDNVTVPLATGAALWASLALIPS